MKFTRIRTNIKAGADISLASTGTLLLGPGGVGKSTILEALYLAVSGSHPAVGKLPSEMAKLAPGGALPDAGLFAEVLDETNGAGMRWSLPVSSEGKATKPTHEAWGWCQDLSQEARTAMLPEMFALADSIRPTGRSDQTMRRSLLARFGSSQGASVLDPPAGLLPKDEEEWRRAAQSALAKTPDTADALAQMVAEFTSASKKAVAQVSALETTLERQRTLIQAIPGAERYEELQRKLKLAVREHAIQSVLDLAKAQDALARHSKDAKATQAIFDASLKEAEAQVANLVEGGASSKRAATLFAKAASQETESKCPYCASGLTKAQAQARAAEFSRRASERREGLSMAETTLVEVRQARDKAFAKIATLSATLQGDATRAEAAMRVALRDAVMPEAEASLLAHAPGRQAYEGPSVAELSKEIAKLDEYRAAKVALGATAVALSEAKTLAERRRTLLQEIVELEKRVAVDACKYASDAVSRHMPIGQARFDLKSFEWQVRLRPDEEWYSLATSCTTTRTAFYRAYALAWTEGASYRVVTVDDQDLLGLTPDATRTYLMSLAQLLQERKIDQVVAAWNQTPDWVSSFEAFGWLVYRLTPSPG